MVRSKKRRPHVLKIDVEGHDYEVLMSFMDGNVKLSELPLLIDFEAKSIAKKYPLAVANMERMYVISTLPLSLRRIRADLTFSSADMS